MALLKKVKGSTLMETLVATILIVIVFVVASSILNNLFSTTVKGNTRDIEAHLNELHYLHVNKKFKLPYQDTIDDWQISIESYTEKNENKIAFEAIHTKNKQVITKEYIESN